MRKIGVICPMFNVEKYIIEFLGSVNIQTYEGDYKLYLVDDCSTDQSYKIAKDYLSANPFCELISNKHNLGWAVRTNDAARLAITDECELLFIANADDILHKDCLKETEAFLTSEIDWVCMPLQSFNSKGEITGNYIPTLDATVEMMLEMNRITNFSLLRASMWKKLNGYDEKINSGNGYEDWDFWIRAIKEGYKYAILNKHLYFYRDHENQTSKKVKHDSVEAIRNKHKI